MRWSGLLAALAAPAVGCGLTCGEGTIEVDGVCEIDPAALRQHAFLKVSAGDRHTCALNEDGAAICWGRNDDGQSSAPDGAFVDVEAGRTHSCALDAGGRATCWGFSPGGVIDAPDTPFVAMSLGWSKSCGLTEAGALDCWGEGVVTPTADAPLRQVSVGLEHICALTENDEPRCWSTDGGAAPPGLSPPPGRYKDLSAGNGFTCAVDFGGVLGCWGSDLDGRVSEAPADGVWVHVTAGHTHACALDSENRLTCWGALPSPEEDWREITNTFGSWTSVSAGKGFHACGSWADGKVLCWGSNDNGQLDVPCINPLDTWSGDGHLVPP